MTNIWLTFFLALGIFGILLFHVGYYIPVWVSVVVFVLVSYLLIRQYRKHLAGPLILLLFLCYALPFIHIIPYLWFDYSSQPLELWGLAVNPYMTDKTIVELMSMIGAVGACGFAVGEIAAAKRLHFAAAASSDNVGLLLPKRTLSMPVFSAWIAMGVVTSWLCAPEQTIFTAAYTKSVSISQSWNFSSLWMFSYAILAFTLADAILERDRNLASLKRMIFLYTLLTVVLWLQLLRGARACLPFVLAAILMFYVWGAPVTYVIKKRKVLLISKVKIALIVLVFFIISLIVGAVRSDLVGTDIAGALGRVGELFTSGQIGFKNILTGTWSAVLLTPLSIAGDYLNDNLSIKYGQTYWDLIASSVPGFVADFIGYQRPIDALHGPAWEMTYGIGGTHSAVVPFMNFRMFGVFAIVATWTYLFTKLERRFSAVLNPVRLAFLGIVATGVPHWQWYGEKNIINSLIIWFLLSLVYQLSMSIHSRKTITTTKELSPKTALGSGI